MLGARAENISARLGCSIPPAPYRMPMFSDFEKYLDEHLTPVFFKGERTFRLALRLAFEQAGADNVVLLQSSVDSRFIHVFGGDAQAMIRAIDDEYSPFKPVFSFFPQLGIDRTQETTAVERDTDELIHSGYFRSIDLYGDESGGEARKFVSLFRKAGAAGMVLTAHAGEYGNARSVKETVDLLGLSQVQHGIGAAESPEVMNWLANHEILLNVCPTSNLRLCRVQSMNAHPVRILFDHGIKVSIATDDIAVFGQSVSDEYLNLLLSGVFSLQELETVRKTGLKAFG